MSQFKWVNIGKTCWFMLTTFVSFQKIFDSHLQQFKDLFGRLRNVDLTLNPTK